MMPCTQTFPIDSSRNTRFRCTDASASVQGEVYRARDTKLDRNIAIKVLPEEFAKDKERLARFEREAKLLASLNHPNIATIHGIEESDGVKALVLELVEGPTLAELIAEGPISVDETLAIAKQMAEALEAGHEAGVIHRDLKPANVKVKEDGTVKVLDYGLAKALAGDAPTDADSELSQSPTLTRHGTQVGVILGTAAYMSPEQAKGKRVDRRSDIWAFGSVVYEMLTGKRAFGGEGVSDTLAAVLRAEVDLDALPADASPAMRTALVRCLEKDPRERVRDIGDVKLAMEGYFESAAAQPSSIGLPARRRWHWAVVAALVSGLAVWAWMRRPTPPPAVAQFVVTAAPSPNLIFGDVSEVFAMSPDGTRLVYRSGLGDFGWLHERRLDRLEGQRIEGSQDAGAPFFSPDGAWIGYSAARELRKIRTVGGAPMTVATLSGGTRGASWGSDGTIIFGDGSTRSLHRVPATGGEPETLIDPDSVPGVDGGAAFWWPEILPGGHAVLFTIQSRTLFNPQIAVLNLETSEMTTLISPGTLPRYASTGHIVYGGGDGTLRAVPFDADRLEVTGAPTVLIDGVVTLGTGATAFAVAANGSLAYAIGDAQAATRLVWVDRAGREELIETAPMTFDHPRVSPDGRRVAVRVGDPGNANLHVVDLDRGTVVLLTRTPDFDTSPVWSPDGSAIIFGSSREAGGVFKIAADGSGAVERLAASVTGAVPLPHAWSRNGEIVFYEPSGPTLGNIYLLTLESSSVDPLLAVSDLREAHPSLSPDGRFLAYTGNESGRSEIYVRPFPNVDAGRDLISPAGGEEPLWSPDGTELFYWDPATASMMVVPVTLEPTFRAGVATRLFEGNYSFPQAGRHYDVSSDGQRFLMVKPGAEDNEAQIVLVQNWFEKLKRLVPTDK